MAGARPASRRPARLDPDTLPALVTAILLTSTLGAVSFVLSYSGLVAVAAWASVPPYLAWTVPVTIDASILVYTLAVFIFRARGERNARVWTSLVLFTAVSVAANAAHAWDAGAGDWHGYAGAAIAGLAPVSVLLTTHTLAELVVARPGVKHEQQKVTPPDQAAHARAQERLEPPDDGRRRGRAQRRSGSTSAPTMTSDRGSAAHADQLHLVEPRTTAAEPMPDAEAVALVRRLDEDADGPVSRRTVERAVGCGASRATRLITLARSGDVAGQEAVGPDRRIA